MSLQRHFENSGSFFFRYRSYYPFVFAPLLLHGWRSFHYIANSRALTGAWLIVCLLVSLLGLAVRVVTIGPAPGGTSGRNTRRQVAQVLRTSGVYSLVRHPLYIGNYLIMLGIFLYFQDVWMVLLMTCLFTLFYERIIFTEEAFLTERFGEEFEEWARTTPAILPPFGTWRPSDLPFSWRTVVKREYPGFFAICIAFFALKVAGDLRVEGSLRIDRPWLILPLTGGLVYLASRTLSKTGLLD